MRVGIVGAGITGLALHHYLSRQGIASTVFEATEKPGGVIRTICKRERILDLGPQRTRLSPTVADLIQEIDLDDNVIEADEGPLYIYHQGRLRRVPKTIREAITTDLLSPWGKLRGLFEPLTALPKEGETVEEYLTRSFGSEIAKRLAGPLYAGLYGSDPDEMYVEHSLAKALDRLGVDSSVLVTALKSHLLDQSSPPPISFTEGMEMLPRTLYGTYKHDVHLDTPIVAIREDHQKYVLKTSNDAISVDEVFLTTPASVSASLLHDVAPESADRLSRLNYNPFAVVHLLAETSLAGVGYQIPISEAHITRGVTWNGGLFDSDNRASGRENLYTCFLGGATTPEAIEWPDERLGKTAAKEFEAVTGHTADPIHVHRVRPGMPAYDRTWTELQRVDPPAGIHLAANYTSRAGIPGRLRQAKGLATRLASSNTTEHQSVTTNEGKREHIEPEASINIQ